MKMPEDVEVLLDSIAESMIGMVTALRVANEIAERAADLDLRMTNIHVQALEIAKEVRKPCPHCL